VAGLPVIADRATAFSRSRASRLRLGSLREALARPLERCAAPWRWGGQGNPALYVLETIMSEVLSAYESKLVARALRVMEKSLVSREVTMSSPEAVRQYLSLRMFALEHEVFVLLMLDARNRLIEARELFRGTLSQTVVYPREVVKAALISNAAAVILAHNHPSGLAEPSQADRMLTDALKRALGTVDVPVLDHLVVAGRTSYSFAEHGLL
jgi:DNA repair protein RadC